MHWKFLESKTHLCQRFKYGIEDYIINPTLQISNLGSERLSNLPKVTQLVNSRTTIRNMSESVKKNIWNTCDRLRANSSEGKNRKWQFTVEEKEITCKDVKKYSAIVITRKKVN